MSRNPFSMYCSADQIAGFEMEKTRADRILAQHAGGGPAIVILAIEDINWVYGQANFPYPADMENSLKFLDRFSTLASNSALEVLSQGRDPMRIFFVDAIFKARFETHKAYASVKSQFRLVADFERGPKAEASGVLHGIKRVASKLWGQPPLAPKPEIDAAETARKCVKTCVNRLQSETNLSEILLFGVMLLRVCSLDAFLDALMQRVAARPSDVIGQTALAMVLTDFGDTAAGLTRARIARGLPMPPPELYVWQAKAAWRRGETWEGLQALDDMCPAPANWPLSIRAGLLALRAALLSQQGEHETAAYCLKQAVEIDGSDAAAHLCLAQVLTACGRFDEARAAAKAAQLIDPKSVLVQTELCRVLAAQGRQSELRRELGKLCISENGRLEARRFVASAELDGCPPPKPGLFEGLDQARQRALFDALLPNWLQLCEASLIFNFFMSFLECGHRGPEDHAKHLSYAFRLLHKCPLDTDALASAGAVWLNSGRPDCAADWLASAWALHLGDAGVPALLAMALDQTDRAAEAYDVLTLAEELGRMNERAKERYCRLIWKLPRLDVISTACLSEKGREAVRASAELLLAQEPELRPNALMALSFATLSDDPARSLDLQREALAARPQEDTFHEFHIATLRAAGLKPEMDAACEAQAQGLRARFPELDATHFAAFVTILLDEGRTDEACKFLRAGLQLDANLPALRLVQARLYIAKERMSEAVETLRVLAFSDADCTPAAAECLGGLLSNEGRHEEALPVWRQLQVLSPASAIGYLGEGFDLWLLDRDAEAAARLELAVACDSDNPGAWGLLGQVLYKLGRLEEAVPALERAVSARPRPPQAILSLALTLIDLGRAAEASAICTAILGEPPAPAEAVLGLTEALSALSRLAQDVVFIEDWLATSSPAPSEILRVIRVLPRQCGLRAAARIGELALKMHADSADLLAEQTFTLVELGQFEEAVVLARKADHLAPHDRNVMYALAHASAHLPALDSATARHLADRLIGASVESTALQHAASVLRAAGMDASTAFEAALAAHEGHCDRAWCQLNLGRLDEADDNIIKAVAEHSELGPHVVYAAIIRFLRSDGSASARTDLGETLCAIRTLEQGAGILAKIRALAPQWRQQSIASQERLHELTVIVDAEACLALHTSEASRPI
ncbi:tetratricopeptide repeat protein [Azorhizobium sp. AG788]|uniref:tetratricopeptide repeat protein n=1 Tax=Azorhizobium sp. AG788 TaxID=2183897 RepID=UPI003139EF5D